MLLSVSVMMFKLYRGSQFYWWRKLEYPEKPIDLSQVTDKLFSIMLYWVHLTWVGFKLTMLVVAGTDCIGNHKSNCHTIILFLLFLQMWFKHKLFFHQILLYNQFKNIARTNCYSVINKMLVHIQLKGCWSGTDWCPLCFVWSLRVPVHPTQYIVAKRGCKLNYLQIGHFPFDVCHW